MALLKIALKQDFFHFNGKIYEQTGGLSIASPLSPVLAELYLDNLEKEFAQSDFMAISFSPEV